MTTRIPTSLKLKHILQDLNNVVCAEGSGMDLSLLEEAVQEVKVLELALDIIAGYSFETCLPEAFCGFRANESNDNCGGDFDVCNKNYFLCEAKIKLTKKEIACQHQWVVGQFELNFFISVTFCN